MFSAAVVGAAAAGAAAGTAAGAADCCAGRSGVPQLLSRSAASAQSTRAILHVRPFPGIAVLLISIPRRATRMVRLSHPFQLSTARRRLIAYHDAGVQELLTQPT